MKNIRIILIAIVCLGMLGLSTHDASSNDICGSLVEQGVFGGVNISSWISIANCTAIASGNVDVYIADQAGVAHGPKRVNIPASGQVFIATTDAAFNQPIPMPAAFIGSWDVNWFDLDGTVQDLVAEATINLPAGLPQANGYSFGKVIVDPGAK